MADKRKSATVVTGTVSLSEVSEFTGPMLDTLTTALGVDGEVDIRTVGRLRLQRVSFGHCADTSVRSA